SPLRGAVTADGLVVEVSYAEPSAARAAARSARRLLGRIGAMLRLAPAGYRIKPAPALVTAIAVAFVLGIVLYFHPWHSAQPGGIANNMTDREPQPPGRETAASSPNQSDSSSNTSVASNGPDPDRNLNSHLA